MSQVATITFVEGSSVSSVNLDDIKQQLQHYREQFTRTGEQLDWEYADAAFPYTIEQKPEAEGKWFYLKATGSKYRHIVLGPGYENKEDAERHYVQLVLPNDSTIGDKNKGNEFAKYLGKVWRAEVQLFNGRTIYYNPRK